MKQKKRLGITCLLLMCMLVITACGKSEQDDNQRVVYKFGDSVITYGEYYVYGKTIEEDYQKKYGNGIWSLELTTEDGKSTVREVTIQDLIQDINRVKVMVAQAEEQEITLSDSEKAEAENQASQFYDGLTEQDRKQGEVTKEIVTQVMEENMLAKKVYDKTIADYDFEISEEEARMTTFYDMIFECYKMKKDGSIEEFTDEKKATQLAKAEEALSSLAQDENTTVDSIVEKYNLQYAASHTMSRSEMIEEYGESVAEKILSLSDGEVSTVIQSEYGYHIFKMLKSNDEDLTKKNKEEIIVQKQKEYFSQVYEGWLKKYDAHFSIEEDVDQDMLNDFPFTADQAS